MRIVAGISTITATAQSAMLALSMWYARPIRAVAINSAVHVVRVLFIVSRVLSAMFRWSIASRPSCGLGWCVASFVVFSCRCGRSALCGIRWCAAGWSIRLHKGSRSRQYLLFQLPLRTVCALFLCRISCRCANGRWLLLWSLLLSRSLSWCCVYSTSQSMFIPSSSTIRCPRS